MKKTIIALWHHPDMGKRSTLCELIDLVKRDKNYNKDKARNSAESEILTLGSTIIGVDLQDEPHEKEFAARLKVLVESCDIVFCTTPIPDDDPLVMAVNEYSEKGYQVIWTSTYHVEPKEPQRKAEQEFFNELKAHHLLNLVQTLIARDK
ncbi:hypothetical protein FACS1894199_14750 [Bacteroidia bacterium]|nr:hypothetical protein FACS1894199_14750 [Bacteroidia bacterium]